MRHHTNCADWGYDTHPDRAELAERCRRLGLAFSAKPSLFARFKFDTRPGHQFMFRGMAPSTCQCIIGRYRGDASCPELAHFDVGVRSDSRVGSPYFLVAPHLLQFEKRCEALLAVHKKWLVEKGLSQSPTNALLKFVSVLADLLQQFLTIHPYMDGNGHCGRMLVYLLMARQGYTPAAWDIDAKQPYSDALSAHRSGKPGALQKFLLQAIVGHGQSSAVTTSTVDSRC